MQLSMKLLLWSLLSIILSGCLDRIAGIDGTGGPNSGGGANPTAKPTISVGRISLENNTNTIRVNGVDFSTDDNSNIIVDDETASIADLANGQVVIIDGELDDNDSTGVAKKIIVNSRVRGPITDITQQSITVLGQTIIINDDTVFGDDISELGDLRVGDVVQINGFKLANDDLSATRIDRIVTVDYEVTGPISRLDEGEQQFTIGELVVDYSQIVPPVLTNALVVEVQGTNINAEGHLIAAAITVVPSVVENATDHVELEGFITEFTSAEDFVIDGITVSTTRQTEFVGDERDDLALNSKIEVEGQLNADGVLEAERVIFLEARLIGLTTKDRLASSSVTFRWNDVGANAYRIVILNDSTFYDQTFNGQTTAVTIDNLPENGARFFLQLYTQQENFWSKQTYDFFGADIIANAEITSHEHGDTLSSDSTTFTWNSVPEADAYRFRITDNLSNVQVVYFEETYSEATPVVVNNLPVTGADLYLILETQHNGWWSRTYKRIKSVQILATAELTSHSDGDKISGPSETFSWSDVNADEYELRISTRRPNTIANGGLFSFPVFYLETFSGDITSVTLDNVPINGSEIFLRLRTRHGDAWSRESYELSGAGLVADAELTSHNNRDVISSETETFSWTEIPDAEEYRLDIYTYSVEGLQRLFHEDYDSHITSATVSGLPRNGANFFLRLSTLQSGFWAHNTYRLEGVSTLANAEFNSHSNQETITTPTVTLSWDDVSADEYNFILRDETTSPRSVLHEQRYGPEVTSVVVNIPTTTKRMRATIATKHGSWWVSKEILLNADIEE